MPKQGLKNTINYNELTYENRRKLADEYIYTNAFSYKWKTDNNR